MRLFPKLREYYVGMPLPLGPRARGRRSDPPPQPRPGRAAVRRRHRAGAPARPACCAAAAPIRRWPTAWAGKAQVIERLQHMLAHGIIRRIGAAPNHYAIGYHRQRHGGVRHRRRPHRRLRGERQGALAQVSHCYHRPRQPGWPYNLFAMCRGDHRDAVRADVALLREQLGSACRGHDVLFSTAMLKRAGADLGCGHGGRAALPSRLRR